MSFCITKLSANYLNVIDATIKIFAKYRFVPELIST